MSSFKRKTTVKPSLPVYPGTRISPASSLSLTTSTGISSLDDILGGGLPLSCSVLYAAPDLHSSYGDLIQKYFVAQGLANGHRICLVCQDPESFAKDIMWFPKPLSGYQAGTDTTAASDGDEDKADQFQKVKIAWRYEKMKQFQTTVGSASQDSVAYCHTFELSNKIPHKIVDKAMGGGFLRLVELEGHGMDAILHDIVQILAGDVSVPVRVCVPSLGSPAWGKVTAPSIMRFLHTLKTFLRLHSHGCASISLPPELSNDSWGGPGWKEKLGWVTDGTLTLSAFSANPALCSIFPSHHGLLRVHRLPSPLTLSPPSDRFSTLRGSTAGSGENNLAFKCTRKRLMFETLHLDVEGGTGERRTTPSVQHTGAVKGGGKAAVVEVEIEGMVFEESKKTTKRVAFEYDY